MDTKNQETEGLETEIQNESPSESEAIETENEKSETHEDETQGESEGQDEDETGEESDPSNDEKKRKSGKGFQKRISRLKRREEEAKREAEFWRAKALENEKAKAQKNETLETNSSNEKPRPDDFDTQEDYIEALTDWKTDQKFQDFEKGQERKSIQKKENDFVKNWESKVETFKETREDFEDVIEDVSHLVFSKTKLTALMESDVGPQLMYEIAKDEELAQKISEMSDTAAIREIGRIEGRLISPTPKVKTKSKAPKPITPIGGGGGKVKKDLYSSTLSQKEYEALRAEQRRARRRA